MEENSENFFHRLKKKIFEIKTFSSFTTGGLHETCMQDIACYALLA